MCVCVCVRVCVSVRDLGWDMWLWFRHAYSSLSCIHIRILNSFIARKDRGRKVVVFLNHAKREREPPSMFDMISNYPSPQPYVINP